MPRIEPFAGIHYAPARTGGLSDVIGPPEDVPSPEHVCELVVGKPYHSLRLEFGDPRTDEASDPRRHYLEKWLSDDILVRSEPAMYVHEHRFRSQGRYLRRLGLLTVADLRDSELHGFRPHEATIPENLQFRIQLLKSRSLSISPIYTLIRDNGKLGEMLESAIGTSQPYLSGHDNDHGVHRLWRLDDPDISRQLKEIVAGQALYIADGHHRYSAAQHYRSWLLEQGIDPGPANYAMTLIVSEQDPGVSVLPIHREIRELEWSWDGILARIGESFEIERLLLDTLVTPALVARRARGLTNARNELPEFLALLHVEGEPQLFRLTLKDWAFSDGIIVSSNDPKAADAQRPVQRLDVTVLHRVILEHALQIDVEGPGSPVEYNPETEQLAKRVIKGKSQLGLFLRSTRIDQVLAIADSGASMPQKSTWFTPKVPAGLMLYDLAQPT